MMSSTYAFLILHPRRWSRVSVWVVACIAACCFAVGCNAPSGGGGGGSGGDNGNTDDGDGTPNARAADCLGCHTNEALLREVAREEPPPAEDTGEG